MPRTAGRHRATSSAPGRRRRRADRWRDPSQLDDGGAVAALAALAGAPWLDERVAAQLGAQRIAQPARAVAVNDGHLGRPGERRVIQVLIQRLERLVYARAAQVEAGWDEAMCLRPDDLA